MIPIVFGKLKDSGFFYDPVARDIESNFIPSLIKNVQVKVFLICRLFQMIILIKNYSLFCNKIF